MKKTFTLGIFLAMVLGMGSNVEAATFTALQSGSWNAQATWFPAGTDTTTKVLPTSADSVSIPAGLLVYINPASGNVTCNNILISGELKSINGGLVAYNNIYVAKTGIMGIKSNFYCANIYNYGKVWCWNTHATGSPKTLFVGFIGSSATTSQGTGDYTILNDSIFGDIRSVAMANNTNLGSGIYINYSNLAKSLTIKTSGKTSGYSFAIGAIYPAAAATAAVSQDFNLNIKESIVLLKNGSVPDLTLHNGDVFAGFNRTCTIFPGDTVFINGGFHMKNAGAPTASAGNMTYNVYGCLDLASLKHPTSSANELDLYTTTFAGSTNSLIMNIGDGTTNNPGTLVLGKTINLIKAFTGQTLQINTSQYSTVKFGYTYAAPTITCTTATATDNTLFPSNPYKFEVATGTYSVTIPTSISASNNLKLTSGTIILGNNNLTANSISGGSATSYVATTGTGTLTVPVAAATSTLLPIGASATSYDAVTVNATSASNISAKVSATLSGTANTGIFNNAKEWTLASSTPSATLLTFKPSAEDASVTSTLSSSVYNALIGQATGTATYTNYSAAYASGSYSATFSTFGSFVTGANSLATALKNGSENALSVFAANKSVLVKNAKAGELVTVYGVNGVKVASSVLNSDNATLPLSAGIYLVKVGTTTTKVAVF